MPLSGDGNCRRRIVLGDPADPVEAAGQGAGYLSGDQFHGADGIRHGNSGNHKGNVRGFPGIYGSRQCSCEQYFFTGGLHYFSGNGGISSDPQYDLEKMVEESGIFRYNSSVGHQYAASDQCDIAHFSEPDLSFADAIPVGIVSDPYDGVRGPVYR